MEPELIQILEMLVAIAAAIIAYWQHRQKITAEETAEEAFAGMNMCTDTTVYGRGRAG